MCNNTNDEIHKRLCEYRDAQTVQVKQVVQQTFADRPTQMTTVGVYVSNVNDRLMTPQHYVTADAFHSNVQ